MNATTWVAISAVASVISCAIAVGILVGKPLRRLSRQNDEFREDWYGRAARPGRGREPGAMERLGAIEAQMQPNGGGSMRDAINTLSRDMRQLNDTFDRHLLVFHQSQGPQGVQGLQGIPGPEGLTGEPGPQGPTGMYIPFAQGGDA